MAKRESLQQSRIPRSQSTVSSSDNPIITVAPSDDRAIAPKEDPAKSPRNIGSLLMKTVPTVTGDSLASQSAFSMHHFRAKNKKRTNLVFQPRFRGKSFLKYDEVLAPNKNEEASAPVGSKDLSFSQTKVEVSSQPDDQSLTTRSDISQRLPKGDTSSQVPTSTNGTEGMAKPISTSIDQSLKVGAPIHLEYTPFNIGASPKQHNISTKVTRPRLGLRKRSVAPKSVKATQQNGSLPDQPRSLSTSARREVVSKPIISGLENKHEEDSENNEIVVGMVSLFLAGSLELLSLTSRAVCSNRSARGERCRHHPLRRKKCFL
jgi:hypothetical protein